MAKNHLDEISWSRALPSDQHACPRHSAREWRAHRCQLGRPEHPFSTSSRISGPFGCCTTSCVCCCFPERMSCPPNAYIERTRAREARTPQQKGSQVALGLSGGSLELFGLTFCRLRSPSQALTRPAPWLAPRWTPAWHLWPQVAPASTARSTDSMSSVIAFTTLREKSSACRFTNYTAQN